MNTAQIRDYIIIPTLQTMQGMNASASQLDSEAAVDLLLRTMCAESGGEYIAQLGGGPARGLFQMEPDSLQDLINNLMPRHTDKYKMLQAFCPPVLKFKAALYADLAFQVVACRLDYWREPEPLPECGDIEGMWRYYKKYWNSSKGDTDRQEFDERCARYMPRD